MKKIILTTLSVLLSLNAIADEGMWMLPTLKKMNEKSMKELGSALSADQIYSQKDISLKDAVVQFGGGCTGEIISARGLLVTNHHCGYSSIQKVSSPEHNYLEDGFWAMTQAEEIPVEGLTVKFLEDMKDVSLYVKKHSREDFKKMAEKLQNEAKKDFPGCEVKLTGFYNQNQYYLIAYKVFRDVRFVGAPPASSGKFGGDTDNWMWPRHTCDFSMFRVYADKNNEPAEYSEDNVPYTPEKFLKISLAGMQEGDFAMIMGFPGRTQRYQTAAQLQKMLDVNDVKIAARTKWLKEVWDARMASPVTNLQYASKYAGVSNGWKKWKGEKESFAKLSIIERQRQKEAELEAWINSKDSRKEQFAGAVETIEEQTRILEEGEKQYTLLNETLGRIDLKPGRDSDRSVDRKVASTMLKHYNENVNPLYKIEVTEAEIDSAFAHTEDAAILKEKIKNQAVKVLERFSSNTQEIVGAGKKYAAALLEWQAGKPMYPDANFTMRLTYGSVKSYVPRDGVLFKHYTTLKGVMEKEDPGNYEFRVPAKLKQIYEEKDYGAYADTDGELPTCFITNCDITGGNSGSPVLNSKGELIGLAFDGNWEAMSSDVCFEPKLQRCICVDIRFVLLMMDKFGGAGYLLDELDIVK